MDIKHTTSVCGLKCAFNFNYPETTIQSFLATNKIILKFGAPAIKPVKFNNTEYTPSQATIMYPSKNLYNGVRADAEISIIHVADYQKRLVIRIPIATASITKPSTLDDIITQTATLLPKTAFVNLKIPSFTLEDYVPKGPFYFSENQNFYEIYYGLDNSLSLSKETMQKMKEILMEVTNFDTLTEGFTTNSDSSDGELFYNSDGANLPSNGGEDFNFMQCEQVYEEEVPSSSGDPGPSPFLKAFAGNPTAMKIFWGFLSTIFAAFILYGFYKTIKGL